MLAEGIARERYEMEVREKAQEKVSYRPDLLIWNVDVQPVWFHCTHVVCYCCAFLIKPQG